MKTETVTDDFTPEDEEKIAVTFGAMCAATAERVKRLRPFLPRMKAAQKTGETCGHCSRTFAPGEAVTLCRWTAYRRSVNNMDGFEPHVGGIAPVCAACIALPPDDHNVELSAITESIGWAEYHRTGDLSGIRNRVLDRRQCQGCGRVLLACYDLLKRKHVYCSRRCYGRIMHPARRPAEAECAGCGSPFTPRRADARYCSAACKQKAFRSQRQQTVPAPDWTMRPLNAPLNWRPTKPKLYSERTKP